MDFDSAYIDPFLDDWLLFLQEKNEEIEEKILENTKTFVQQIGLQSKDVKLIFSIVDQFKLPSNAKYLAIHLYERYINFKSWETSNILQKSKDSKSLSRREQMKLNSESKLRLLSCIQLASKMDSNEIFFRVPQVKRVLREIEPDKNYSNKIILESEFYVFKCVKFEMPIYTLKNCVDILLAESGLRNTPDVLKSSSKFLDLSYIFHEELYFYLETMTHGGVSSLLFQQKSALLVKSNALFLGASIVLCSVLVIGMERRNLKELLKKVASFVELKESDIWDMANLLFSLAH